MFVPKCKPNVFSDTDLPGGIGVATDGAVPVDIAMVMGGGVPGGVVSIPLSSIIFCIGAL